MQLIVFQLINAYDIEIGILLSLHIKIENKEVIIINLYGPNKKDDIVIFREL